MFDAVQIKSNWEALTSKAYGFWRSLVFALLLALASFSGVFTPLDGRLYDFFVRNGPVANNIEREVLLVDTPVSAFFDSDIAWDEVVSSLIQLGARQVVFTIFPDTGPPVVKKLLEHPKVILGTDLTPDPEHADSERFHLPPNFSGWVPHAVAEAAPRLLGVHRYQQYAYQASGIGYPSIEALTARRLGIEVPERGSYLINFRGAEREFPRIRLGQLLEREVIKEMVDGRVALIGIGKERLSRTLVTPITAGQRELTKLDFHGYALDSLLREAPIVSLHPVVKALVVLQVWLFCFFLFQPFPFRSAVALGSLIILGLFAFAWLALVSRGVHVPIVSSILVVATSAVAVFQSKSKHQNRALEHLATETGLAASGRWSQGHASTSPEFWNYVLGMSDQILPLTRAVLLERGRGKNDLRAISFLRCSDESIIDGVGELNHPPYSATQGKNEPVELENYFKRDSEGEHQFLAPLLWRGRLVGYWAFGIHAGHMEQRPALMHAASMLTVRLSELMAERQAGVAEESRQAKIPGWHESLVDRRDVALQDLAQNMTVIERHVQILEDIFHGLAAPTIVYDLFGQALISNERMKRVLKAAGVEAEEKSAVDFLQMVCTLSRGQAHAALIGVVFNDIAFEQAGSLNNQPHLLHVSGLHQAALEVAQNEEVLQNMHGVMIQLFPLSYPSSSVRNGSHSSIPAGTDAEEKKTDLSQMLESLAASLLALPEYETLGFVMNDKTQHLRVQAHPKHLADFLFALLQLVADDTRQPGSITLTAKEQDGRVILDLHNEGFGMPDAKLQAMLEGSKMPDLLPLRRLVMLRDKLFVEQEHFTLSSAVGRGYTARIIMFLARQE